MHAVFSFCPWEEALSENLGESDSGQTRTVCCKTGKVSASPAGNPTISSKDYFSFPF